MWARRSVAALFSSPDLRHRRALASAVAAGAASIMTMAVSVLSVPPLLRALGPERFGLWATLNAFVAMLGFLDFGIGLALISALAEARGREDSGAERRLTATALILLAAAGGGLALVSIAVAPIVPWSSVFNTRSAAQAAEMRWASTALLLLIALSIPAGLGARIRQAHQRGWAASLWDLYGRALSLAALFALITPGITVVQVVLAIVGVPAAITAVGTLWLFFGPRHTRPAARGADRASRSILVDKGVLFICLQIISALTFASDNLVISQVIGPAAVADYAVPRTLFQIVISGAMLFLLPLWPAYTDAITRGEQAWVVRTVRLSILGTVGFVSVLSLTLVLWRGPVFTLWLGPGHAAPSLELMSGFALLAVVSTAGSAMSIALNAASIIRFQVLTASIMGAGAIAAKIAGAGTLGLSGVIWGTVAAYSLLSLFPTVLYVRRWLGRLAPVRKPA